MPTNVGQIFHAFLMGTAENLNATQNIGVMTFMESEVIKLAKVKGYKGVFTTNTNPLTKQIGESVFGYETLSEVQVNKFVDTEGNRPFGNGADTLKSNVMYKDLTK